MAEEVEYQDEPTKLGDGVAIAAVVYICQLALPFVLGLHPMVVLLQVFLGIAFVAILLSVVSDIAGRVLRLEELTGHVFEEEQ